MGKCPRCAEEIDHLRVEREEYALLRFTADGEYEYIESKDAGQQEDFICPACRWPVAGDSEEAREILRGEEL